MRAADNALRNELILLVLAALMIAGAMWVSTDRRRTALTLGVAIVIAGIIGVVALSGAKALVLARIDRGRRARCGGGDLGCFPGRSHADRSTSSPPAAG